MQRSFKSWNYKTLNWRGESLWQKVGQWQHWDHGSHMNLRVHQNVKSYISKDTVRNAREHRVRRDCLDTQGTEPVQSNRGPDFSVEEGLDTHFSSEDREMVKRRRCWVSLDPRPILNVHLAVGKQSAMATKKVEKSELSPDKNMERYNCFGKEFGIFPKSKTVNIQPAHQSYK